MSFQFESEMCLGPGSSEGRLAVWSLTRCSCSECQPGSHMERVFVLRFRNGHVSEIQLHSFSSKSTDLQFCKGALVSGEWWEWMDQVEERNHGSRERKQIPKLPENVINSHRTKKRIKKTGWNPSHAACDQFVTVWWLSGEHMKEDLQSQSAFHIAELPREAEPCWNCFQ